MNAHHRTILVLAGCLLVAGGVCVLAGCGEGGLFGAIERVFGGADTKGTGGSGSSGVAEPYNIAALFWTYARILIGLGIAGVVASIFAPVIPTRACASVAAAGIGCAIVAKFFAAYGWIVYAAFGVGAVVCLWPFVEAFRRWSVAKATGQPVKGHAGTEALKQLIPFARKGKPNARQDSRRDGGGGGPVLPA